MTRLLGTLVILCALIFVVGYFRGWFHVDSTNSNGQGSATVTVDKDKVTQDKNSATQAVQDMGHK